MSTISPPPKKKTCILFKFVFYLPPHPLTLQPNVLFFSGSVNNSEFVPPTHLVASPSSGVSRVPYHDHFPPPARRNPHLTLQWNKATMLNVTTNHTLPKDGHGFWGMVGWCCQKGRSLGCFLPKQKHVHFCRCPAGSLPLLPPLHGLAAR